MSSNRGTGSAVPVYRQATLAEPAPPARYPSVAVSLTSELDIYMDESEPPPEYMYTNEPLEMEQTSFQSLPTHAASGKEHKQAQAVGAQPPPPSDSDSDSDDDKKVKKAKKAKKKAEKKVKKVKTKAKEGTKGSPPLQTSTSSTTFGVDQNGNVAIVSSVSQGCTGSVGHSRRIRPRGMKAAVSLPASMPPPPNPRGYFPGGFHPSTSGPPPAPFNVAYGSSTMRQSASRASRNAHPRHRKSKHRSNDSSSSSSSSSESSSSSDSESSSSDSESSDEDVKPSRVSYRCQPLRKGGKEKKVKEKSMSSTYPFQPMAMPTMGVFMGGPPMMDLARQISADVHAYVRKDLERSLKKSKKLKNMN